MEQYIINKLALEKAQMEVNLLQAIWTIEQRDMRIKQLEEELSKLKGSE